MPNSKRRSQMSSRRLRALWSQTVDADEPGQAKEIDSLLLSSLRLWEVEHNLIEQRMEHLRRTKVGGGVNLFPMPAAKLVQLKRPLKFDHTMRRLVKLPPPPSGKKAKKKVWRKKRR